MKKMLISVVSVVLVVTETNATEQGVEREIRRALDGIERCYSPSTLRKHYLSNEWEFVNLGTNEFFIALSRAVSNDWSVALACLPNVSTNDSERMMIVAAGTIAGESNFLARIDVAADMVLSNKLTSSELVFYRTQCSIADHYAASSLVRRYHEPAISNLIMKLNAAGCYPRGVSDIFSGDAKELYLDAVHDGLIGP